LSFPADDLVHDNACVSDLIPSQAPGLGSHLSRPADDVVHDDDGISDLIWSQPPSLGPCLSCPADDLVHDNNGVGDLIPSQAPGLGSCLSRPADEVIDQDNGTSNLILSQPPGLGSCLSCPADDLVDDNHGVSVLIPSQSPALSSCLSRSADDVVHERAGISDLIPSQPPGLISFSLTLMAPKLDSTLACLRLPRMTVSPTSVTWTMAHALVLLHLIEDLSCLDDDNGTHVVTIVDDSVPSEPSEVGSDLASLVVDLFGRNDDHGIDLVAAADLISREPFLGPGSCFHLHLEDNFGVDCVIKDDNGVNLIPSSLPGTSAWSVTRDGICTSTTQDGRSSLVSLSL
jgi:hypothetical protein